MRWLIRIAIGLAVIMGLFVIVGLTLDKHYRVERSRVIPAPAYAVHFHVSNLERWQQWEPWRASDPSLEVVLGPNTTGVGASQSWDDESGGGRLEFTAVDPERGIDYDMHFGADDAMQASAQIHYAPSDAGTRVTWSMQGSIPDPIFGGYVALLMDDMLGPMFDTGLDDLAAAVAAYPGHPPPAAAPLGVGDTFPRLRLRNADNEEVDLSSMLAAAPSVLIFYRGGWCPFCNSHLADLAQNHDRVLRRGWQIIGISPDRPQRLQTSLVEGKIPYTLLSDAEAVAIQATGLSFVVDADTRQRYATHGIDLAAASGHDHYRLPHPAVYLVNRQGEVMFAHVDKDYRQRLRVDDMLAAIDAANE